MTASESPSLPQRDELRELVARALYDSDPKTALPWDDPTWSADRMRRRYRRQADAVLALPAVAALRNDLAERVTRVMRESRINCTGPGEVGCPKIKGWHSWAEHEAHIIDAVLDLCVIPPVSSARPDEDGGAG